MIYDNTKEPTGGREPEPSRSPCPRVEEIRTHQPSVVSIQGWKQRPVQESPTLPADTKPTKKNLHLLSRPQKQGALLRLILSDTILEEELDAMIKAAVSVVTGRGESG
jgi:hypothetical protein